MSLLGNLVAQVARSAMDPDDAQRNPVNQQVSPRRTGGLGDILGSVLGGANQGSQGGNQHTFTTKTATTLLTTT